MLAPAQLFCPILSSKTFLERPARGGEVGPATALVLPGPVWGQVCTSGLGLSPQTPANLECWNFLSDFHFPPLFSPLSETKTLFNCILWSASQDIIILIKCFLWGSARAWGVALEAACPPVIIGSNSAIRIKSGH